MQDQESSGNLFPETRWSMIGRLAQSGVTGEKALADLCEIYWLPIYLYLRKREFSPEDCEDLTQSFFEKIVRSGSVADASSKIGKLRSYILTQLNNHRVDEWRRSQAQRRGGDAQILSLDRAIAERKFEEIAERGLSPDEAFDQGWFDAMLSDVRKSLRQIMEQRGREKVFDILEPFLDEGKDDPSDWEKAAAELKLTAGSIRVTVHRLRERFRQMVRERIEDTVEGSSALAEELAYFGRLRLEGCDDPPE